MKSVYIGDILISPFSLFFQKPINDFLNYEKKLILAGLIASASELRHFSLAGPNPAGAASNIEQSTSWMRRSKEKMEAERRWINFFKVA
jgi:hypothetical protein